MLIPSKAVKTATKKIISRQIRKGKITISIDLVDHVLQLGLCRVLPERPHDSSQFFGSDGAIAVLIEQRKGLLELGDLLLRQLIRL